MNQSSHPDSPFQDMKLHIKLKLQYLIMTDVNSENRDNKLKEVTTMVWINNRDN